MDPDDELDGCDCSGAPPLDDQDVDGIVLFADVDRDDVDAIERRADEWRRLFGGA